MSIILGIHVYCVVFYAHCLYWRYILHSSKLCSECLSCHSYLRLSVNRVMILFAKVNVLSESLLSDVDQVCLNRSWYCCRFFQKLNFCPATDAIAYKIVWIEYSSLKQSNKIQNKINTNTSYVLHPTLFNSAMLGRYDKCLICDTHQGNVYWVGLVKKSNL